MGLFGALVDVAFIPVRAAVDVVTLPVDIVEGNDVFTATEKGFRDLKKEVEEI